MKFRIVVIAILVSLLQISLHSINSSWVIPNLVLIFVIWYAPKIEYVPMTLLIVLMSAIIRTGSVLPVGLELLGLFLVLLASKLVLRDGRDASKWSFQLALVAGATVLLNIVFYATLPAEALSGSLAYIGLRIMVELLYNSIILLLVVGWSERQSQTHPHYHLSRK